MFHLEENDWPPKRFYLVLILIISELTTQPRNPEKKQSSNFDLNIY